jgi:hypothetical protein
MWSVDVVSLIRQTRNFFGVDVVSLIRQTRNFFEGLMWSA